jgi:hypothetical protein
MRVRFENVGRGKASWDDAIDNFGSPEMISDALERRLTLKKPRPLASRDVSVSWDSDTKTGIVFAGMHGVGTVRAIEEGGDR